MENVARKRLIIFGIAKHAEMVAEWASTQFEVVAFTANRRFVSADRIGDFPLHPFEELSTHCDPAMHAVHVALEYSRQSADRGRFVIEAEKLGFSIASVIHPSAIIAPSARIGRHALVGEGVTVQSFARIGANVAINAGSLVGMSAEIADHVYLGTRVTVERYSRIATNCTIGNGSTIAEGKVVAAQSTLEPRSVVTRDIAVGTLTHPFLTRPGRIIDKSSSRIPAIS